MKDLTEKQLQPFMKHLAPLECFAFAAGFTPDAWKELAKVLAEESKSLEHSKHIVEEFVRTPRYDEKGQLVTAIPSSIELRMFSRGVTVGLSSIGPLPEPCPECAPYGGRYRIVAGPVADGAARCLCKRGQALAAMDAARVGSAPPEKRGPAPAKLTPVADVQRRAAGDAE